MNQNGFILRTNAQRYALTGAAFGLFFPIIATVLRMAELGLTFSFSSILAVHLTDPLLWIIDTAPIFLGLFAAIAGRRQDELEKTNQMLRSREMELQAAQLVTEQRVLERTQELSFRNQAILERAEHLKSVVDTSRSLLAAEELDRLLPLIVQVIGRQFKYYHVGIYLLDEQMQRAILKAASSEGGLKLIQRGEQLRLGERSVVEFAIRSGQAHFIEDTSKDPMFRPELALPDTRSELVLPLKAGQAILGALDLQADTPHRFYEEYVSILSLLADLVTIAIQNSIQNENTRRALRDVEVNSRQVSARAWGGWLESIRTKGYRYDGIRSEPLKEANGSSPNHKRVQSIPIRLRGRTIGSLKIKLSEASQGWTEDERAIAEATAERAALALEGARLLEEAQKRATREAFLAEIAAKLGTSFRLDSILRDTVEELGQTLEGSTVSFQLINPTAAPSPDFNRSSEPPAISRDSE